LSYEPATVIYVSVLGFLLSLFGSVGTHTTVPTVYFLFCSTSFTSLSYFDLWPLLYKLGLPLATDGVIHMQRKWNTLWLLVQLFFIVFSSHSANFIANQTFILLQ